MLRFSPFSGLRRSSFRVRYNSTSALSVRLELARQRVPFRYEDEMRPRKARGRGTHPRTFFLSHRDRLYDNSPTKHRLWYRADTSNFIHFLLPREFWRGMKYQLLYSAVRKVSRPETAQIFFSPSFLFSVIQTNCPGCVQLFLFAPLIKKEDARERK